MKKLMVFLLLILNLFVDINALKLTKIKIGDPIGEGYKYGYAVHDSFGPNFVYKDRKGNYIVTVSFSENLRFVTGICVFSSNGKFLECEGLNLIDCDTKQFEQLKFNSLQKIKQQYGDIHCDFGSGQLVPAYIMKNATIFFLQGRFEEKHNSNITGIGYWDIIGKNYTDTILTRNTAQIRKNIFSKFFNF